MITVRTALPGDGATLLRMTKELSKTHFIMNDAVTAENYERALFQPHAIVGALIALIDDVPAGAAIWHRSFSTNAGAEIMYVEELVVLPEFRRRGVAKLLMHEVCKLAVAKNHSKVYWMVMEWNEGALSLYRDIGALMEKAVCYCFIEGEALQRFADAP